MKLESFSVKNFRSITNASNINFGNLTVLIGKNNEGKSNLLKALNISMNILERHSNSRLSYLGSSRFRENENIYVWQRDFPISLQDKKTTNTTFRLKFELTEDELQEFKEETKSSLNGSLPIEIKIGKDQRPIIKVVKRGRGSKTLNQKSKKIADYIGNKIQFNYIPAIRTDKESIEVINDMLSKALESIESDERYEAALNTIHELQEPIINQLSEDIKTSLIDFLPNIKEVFIESFENRRRYGLRSHFEVFIDDGTKTHIAFKGDGVKSLAALGLLKNITNKEGAYSLIAIEEPESHLHPGAIHLLKSTIQHLSKTSQVIVSTHNPLFVNRHNVKSNIVIDNGNAKPAKKISEIREIIGVKASDNLINARFVLVVEGADDVISLKAILSHLSPLISKSIKDNLFVIEEIGGASKLSYKLSLLSNALCNYHVLLDNDKAGTEAFEKAESDKMVTLKNVTFINCKGMPESEFEDCISKDVYKNELYKKFGVDINCKEFKQNKKWSNRIKECFQTQGKPWSDNIENQVKLSVAESIVSNVENSLNEHKSQSILALKEAIESLLNEIT